MNDYHSNETTNTYTDTFRDCPKRARVKRRVARRDCPWPALAAPSSKTWDGARNCAGATLFWEKERFPRAPFVENLARFSLGSARGLSFSEKKHPSHIQTHPDQDDAYWEYWYDGRLRLTKAERDNSGDELQKRYTYIYDDGDNMLTKVVYDAVGESTTTTAFEYTNANELTKQTEGGTTTNFTYDKYGRMTGKTQGGYSATYAYRYSQMLYSVTSDFPGEGTVTYEYGGDLKRRERTTGGTTTNYNWDAGFTMINEEDSGGDLTMTYIGKLADVSGDDPSAGTWRYYSHDHLGSTRRLRAADKSSLGQYEYTPYGEIYAESGASIPWKYTGHMWDDTADLYYAPFRYYNPTLARWTTRDPLGMIDGPNVYAYGKGNPAAGADPLGTTMWDNLLFLYDWATNREYELRYYGEDTRQVQELRSGDAAAYMRKQYIAAGCPTAEKGQRPVFVNYSTLRGFYAGLLWNLVTFDWGEAGIQVGGFTGTVQGVGGKVRYTISNTAGRKSFFYHIPFVEDVMSGYWGANIDQVFEWYEDIPPECLWVRDADPMPTTLILYRFLYGYDEFEWPDV